MVSRFRDPQYREVYSNVSMTSLSPFDITIVFQKMMEVAPGQPAIVDQVAVSFSPQQFKALVKSFTETINGYESAYGELTIPAEDIAPQRTASEVGAAIQAARETALEQRKQKDPISSSAPEPQPERSASAPRKKGKTP